MRRALNGIGLIRRNSIGGSSSNIGSETPPATPMKVKYSPLSMDAADVESVASTTTISDATNNSNGDLQSDDNNAVDSGTQSQWSATMNLAKCICGAGSFALPHVFLQEGVLGGTIALTLCGGLAALTMKSLAHSQHQLMKMSAAVRQQQQEQSTKTGPTCSTVNNANNYINIGSYVDLAHHALGSWAANLVFLLTMSASIGVCSTYLVFIGQTLESLSLDESSQNVVYQLLPNVSATHWQIGTTLVLWPLAMLRSYGIFAFTSTLGVVAVMGGIVVTLASGMWVNPGGGLRVALDNVVDLPLWPASFASALGESFGTIAYLFCINFLTFPILNSMESPKEEYAGAVNAAVAGVWLVNVIFAILCLGFYGADTQDLVLGNLDNGPYLSALKLLLCVDLLFTFPIVFSGGRHILEHAIFGKENHVTTFAPARIALVTGAMAVCLSLAQLGGFGKVTNLVGGVAQGTLAFIMPPAIAVAVARRHGGEPIGTGGELGHYALGAFGVTVVCSVTYFTLVSS